MTLSTFSRLYCDRIGKMRLVVFNCIWIALGSCFQTPSVGELQAQLGLCLNQARVAKLERSFSGSDDFYTIMGLGPSASSDAIKKRFRRLSLEHHPDKNLDNVEQAGEKFKAMKMAYETLSDANKRLEYDNRNSGNIDDGTRESLRKRAVGDVLKLAKATHELLAEKTKAGKLVELGDFGKTWESLKEENGRCQKKKCTWQEREGRFSRIENKLIGMIGGEYKKKLSTDLLDYETVFWTIVSDVRYIVERKQRGFTSFTPEEAAVSLSTPLVDATFALMRELADGDEKQGLIYQYLSLMRRVGVDSRSFTVKRSKDVLKFSESVERILKNQGRAETAGILSRRRRAIEGTLFEEMMG